MKTRIAIITGGNSSEAVISEKSAASVFNTLDHEKYECYLIRITGQNWVLRNEPYSGINIDKNDFSFVFLNKKITFSVVLNIIHGTPGEDGLLPAYFKMLSIPYCGNSVLTAALTFNKNACKNYLKAFGVTMAKSLTIYSGQNYELQDIAAQIGFPCFIKPNEGGSSVGMSRVNKFSDLQPAIDKAFAESPEIIIEQYIAGTELTCGVVRTKNRNFALPVTEVISKNEFFDFEAKYNADKSIEITPARISNELTALCQQTALQIANNLDCKGISRVDFIFSDNKFYFLEINTIPGLTETSFIPQQVRAAELTMNEIWEWIINDL